jgi:hypothetical protein
MLGFSLPRTTPTNSTGATDEIYFCLCNKFRLYSWCVSVPKEKRKYRRHLNSFWPYEPKPSPRATLTPLGRSMSLLYWKLFSSCETSKDLPFQPRGSPRCDNLDSTINYAFWMCVESGLLNLSLELILLWKSRHNSRLPW